MTTVVIVDAAEEQLGEIVEWWAAHREASPLLVTQEFDRCVSLLEASPDVGVRFLRSRVPGVRRLVMKRTKHHVYYLHDEPTVSSTSSRCGRTQGRLSCAARYTWATTWRLARRSVEWRAGPEWRRARRAGLSVTRSGGPGGPWRPRCDSSGGPVRGPCYLAGVSSLPSPQRAHVLDVPFAMRGVAAASKARWDKEHGVFIYDGAALPPALAPFRAQPYSWEMHVQRELAAAPPRKPSPPHASITLRAHQQEAARAIGAARAASLPGFLLADDVGLGKTITAWAAVLAMPAARRVLVVCPLAVIAHWRRTIEAMGDGGKDIVVLNYDRLGKLFEVSDAARKKIRTKKGLARAGTAPELDVIILDESHRLKNPTAARSKLAAKLVANAGFCLWLSATAGQNPLELSYLAPLLARTTGSSARDLKDFEQWCLDQQLGVTRGNFGKWEWRGERSDCEKVRAMLFEPARAGQATAGIRRQPEQIAGWPAINRILAPIELAAEARALYEEAWTAFRREMELAPRGRDPKSALAASLRLRQKSSLIRAPGTIELARELLDNGHQVAISVAFLETLTALREAFETGLVAVRCAAIHGGIPAAAREAERLRFQRGEARVVLFTVEEGISLHQGEHDDAPRSEVIHDLRWSAIQMAQIEGRCHRDGRFAQVYWTYADDTVEEKIARVVAGRIQSMKEMIGDDTETLREIENLLRG